MKHFACILLSIALLAFAPATSSKSPMSVPQVAISDQSDAEMISSDETADNVCCASIQTCANNTCNSTKCSAGEVIAMPAVGIYAPLLDPQKPKISKAKSKLEEEIKGASTSTKTLKP